ncbi:PREDICTED: transmembrane protein 82 [Corvus brachyrhynchos]|uniref:transmembrane protein 82 n=1 Tax=Corvus brachyrhynchos TaxID=85066 RepID=UPI00081671CC|nr:PREDICTED: transmembrane protein 82 [Corvus brachyrhynchos]
MFSLGSWLPALPGLAWGWALLDGLLQGLVGACAVSVLCSLLKVYLYIQCVNNPERQVEKEAIASQRPLLEPLHVLVLTGVLALVGSRVAALVVLEFSLRAVSTVLSLGKGARSSQLYLLCQYSLGCGVSCGLSFLLEGAPHRSWNLALAAGGAGGHPISPLECLVSPLWGWEGPNVPVVAPQCRVLTEEPRQSTGRGLVFRTVVVRMGGLFILLLTVGRWTDILHVFVSFLGELWCLLCSGVLLESCWRQDFAHQPRLDSSSGSRSEQTSR